MAKVEQVDRIGEYITLQRAAKDKRTTVNALYLYIRDRGIQVRKVGNTIVVRQDEVSGYERTWNAKKVK